MEAVTLERRSIYNPPRLANVDMTSICNATDLINVAYIIGRSSGMYAILNITFDSLCLNNISDKPFSFTDRLFQAD